MADNKNNSSIAIVIPCYNAQKTIQKTFDSIFAQTCKSFKIYAVNDGSTDGTPDILNTYQKKYPDNILIINQENQGQAKARNRGISESIEEYIAFIDSDDLWHPQKLEKQFEFLKTHQNKGLCYTKGLTIDEQDNHIGTIPVNPMYRGKCFSHLILSNNIVASSVMIRRSVIDHAGMFDTKLDACENWDLWLRISQQFSIDFIDEPLTFYRIHSSNMSQNSDKMYENRKKVLEKHLLFPKNKNELVNLAAKAFHKHHKLHGQRLVEELRLSEARREFINAIGYNLLDLDSYKILLKTILGKKVFLLARKIKKLGFDRHMT